jgi:hypothetical protein
MHWANEFEPARGLLFVARLVGNAGRFPVFAEALVEFRAESLVGLLARPLSPLIDPDRLREPECRPTSSRIRTTSAPRKLNLGSIAGAICPAGLAAAPH